MNTPNKYDRAIETIKNATDDNSTIAIAETQSPNNRSDSKSAITIADLLDYNKPMGVATYTTTADMPENLRKALPDVEELRKVMEK